MYLTRNGPGDSPVRLVMSLINMQYNGSRVSAFYAQFTPPARHDKTVLSLSQMCYTSKIITNVNKHVYYEKK